MKQFIKRYINRVTENIASRIIPKIENGSLTENIANRIENGSLADNIAYRVALETVLNNTTKDKKPNEIFYGISDDFWFWLNTEGCRRNPVLRSILPGTPDEYTQEMFTGAKGDKTLREAFYYYQLFREHYQKHKGPLAGAGNMLDFGCGWGRIIRFFIKDTEPSKIWGCDPVEEMIQLCKEQNRWCNFVSINTSPPTSFQENTFDLIYSFSVFSHLSEDLHLRILTEINRILRPGGIYMTTTRNRGFIELCAEMRKRTDLDAMNPGPRSSATAFPDTQESLAVFDQGLYCHYSFNDERWPFWGETAIPKKYVLDHWTQNFVFLDYLEDPVKYPQSIIIVQKPFDKA